MELADTINGSFSHNDTDAFSNKIVNSSQEKEIEDFHDENEIRRHDRLMESMEIFSNEINKRLSKK